MPLRVSGTAEAPACNYQLCVIGAGTTPMANALTTAVLATMGSMAARTVTTASARDANALSETGQPPDHRRSQAPIVVMLRLTRESLNEPNCRERSIGDVSTTERISSFAIVPSHANFCAP